MSSFFLLAALSFGLTYALAELFGDPFDNGGATHDDDETDQPDERPDRDEDENEDEGDDDSGGVTFVTDGSTLAGTNSGDVFLVDPDAVGAVETTIDGGDGNDYLDLRAIDNASGLVSSEIDGGAGDDIVALYAESSVISGGDGDDRIDAEGFGLSVLGGSGSDDIGILTADGDGSSASGGDGNDILDARGSNNVQLAGDDGDDYLVTNRVPLVGTGYTVSSDGGDGDDTLRHEVSVFPLPDPETPVGSARLTGGDGEDTFEIAPVGGGGSFTESEDDPDTFTRACRV